MNTIQIEILKAIQEGKTNEQAIAEFLNISPDRVYQFLEDLQQQGYIEGSKGSPYFGLGRHEYHDCWLTTKGTVIIEHPEDFNTMPRNDFASQVLKAIDEGYKDEEGIALHLNVEQYRVHSALKNLAQEGYIRGAKSLHKGGHKYVSCVLTPEGKTRLNYPEDISEKNQPNFKQEFNFTGSNIGSVTGSGHIENATINYSAEQRQSLGEAAREIQELLDQLSQTYNSPNSLNNLEIATAGVKAIEKNQALKSKIIKVLKAAGTEALKELIDHPAVNILMAGIESWKDD